MPVLLHFLLSLLFPHLLWCLDYPRNIWDKGWAFLICPNSSPGPTPNACGFPASAASPASQLWCSYTIHRKVRAAVILCSEALPDPEGTVLFQSRSVSYFFQLCISLIHLRKNVQPWALPLRKISQVTLHWQSVNDVYTFKSYFRASWEKTLKEKLTSRLLRVRRNQWKWDKELNRLDSHPPIPSAWVRRQQDSITGLNFYSLSCCSIHVFLKSPSGETDRRSRAHLHPGSYSAYKGPHFPWKIWSNLLLTSTCPGRAGSDSRKILWVCLHEAFNAQLA